jgi:hypothetical protein
LSSFVKATIRAASALGTSFASVAFSTLFTADFTEDLKAAFNKRFFSLVRLRLSCSQIFAMFLPPNDT